MRHVARTVPLVVAFFALGVTAAPFASARVHRRGDVTVSASEDPDVGASALMIRLPDVGIQNPRHLVTAVLEFRVRGLDPGDELELWLAPEEELPWREAGEPARRIDIWIADQRTVDLVRFDLTPILRRALAESAGLPHLVVRRTPDAEGIWADLDLAVRPDVSLSIRRD